MRRNRRLRKRAMAAALLPVALLATSLSISNAAQGTSGRANLNSSRATVAFGQPFALGGHVSGRRGSAVRVQFRGAGRHAWKLAGRVHTDKGGRYGIRARARVSGEFRAIPGGGRPSAPEAVRVRSKTSFHLRTHHIVLGDSVGFSGAVKPGGRRGVKIVAKGAGKGAVGDLTSANGRFGAKFTPKRTGVYTLRPITKSDNRAAASRGPGRKVTVYRYAVASWYGGSLYGNGTACGGTLTPTTMGVANKSLPCGTKVHLRYRGRSVTVPVIDRGPYVAGRDYDLTEATKNALGINDGVVTLLASR